MIYLGFFMPRFTANPTSANPAKIINASVNSPVADLMPPAITEAKDAGIRISAIMPKLSGKCFVPKYSDAKTLHVVGAKPNESPHKHKPVTPIGTEPDVIAITTKHGAAIAKTQLIN